MEHLLQLKILSGADFMKIGSFFSFSFLFCFFFFFSGVVLKVWQVFPKNLAIFLKKFTLFFLVPQVAKIRPKKCCSLFVNIIIIKKNKEALVS
jgi:hypothetical protein